MSLNRMMGTLCNPAFAPPLHWIPVSGIEEALGQMSKQEHAMFILPAEAMQLQPPTAHPCSGALHKRLKDYTMPL
jgi:hypothetical protein